MTIGAIIALVGLYFGFNCVTYSIIYKKLISSAEGVAKPYIQVKAKE
tara:strand:- start:4330 stop:4470 length:141 start_codon:yes stop_codon:yes gene_type:complete